LKTLHRHHLLKCVYIFWHTLSLHVLHNIETLVGQKNKGKLGQQQMPCAIGSQALIYVLSFTVLSNSILLRYLLYDRVLLNFLTKVAIKYRSNSTFLTRLCPISLYHITFCTPLLFHKYSPEIITFISGVLAKDLSITTTKTFLILHSSFAYTIYLFFAK
jgi:hypothetical protein